MKISDALGPLWGVWFGLTIAFIPTIKALLRDPRLFFQPHQISRIYMANQWLLYGDGIDGNAKAEKEKIISPHAYGRVLDLGAGHGHTVRYLDRSRVTQYIALEPNTLMHPFIRTQAVEFGYNEADGSLVILSCGAEEIDTILAKLATVPGPFAPGLPGTARGVSVQTVDTLISVMTLCTVPYPEKSITSLVRLALKPGGHFLMYEHVLNPLADVAWWQRFWAPLWAVQFDGCRIDRQTDALISGLKIVGPDGIEQGAWRDSRMWNEDEPGKDNVSNYFFHTFGVFIRR